MGLVSTLHATIIDKFARHFPVGRRRILLLLVICATQFILALSLCTSVRLIHDLLFLPISTLVYSTVDSGLTITCHTR